MIYIQNEVNMKKPKPKKLFRCSICDEMKERGSFVEILYGPNKGLAVKVCTKTDCIVKACSGSF